MQDKRRAWATFTAANVGMFVGLALDRALFWNGEQFELVFAIPITLLMAGLCYWAMSLFGKSRNSN